jgi:exosortase
VHSSSLFYWWGYQWINPASETQHGLLILAIAAWLLFRNVRAEPRAGGCGFAAAGAMAAGLGLHALGFVAEQQRLSIAGLLLFLWGLAAEAGGKRWARASAFPLAFMLFAVPLSALDSTGFWLRMGVVKVSSWIAHLAGISVIVNGTQLLSPDRRYDYDVAAACSGVRSLIALSALSLLVGYLRFSPWWLRVATMALSLPLIFVGNVARIVSIIVAANWGGQSWGDTVHEVMGYGVFAIVLGGVVAAAGCLERARPAWAAPRRPLPPNSAGGGANSSWLTASIVAALSLLVAGFLAHISGLQSRGSAGVRLTPDGSAPVSLPTFIGNNWVGQDADVTAVERELLPPDTGYSRKTYVSLDDPNRRAFLSIVLSGRDRTSIHRPELCLVGQGWTIRGSFLHEFVFPSGGGPVPATVLEVEKQVMTPRGPAAVPQLVAYYFVGGSGVVASSWKRLFLDAWNRVFHARADRWAYVLVQTSDQDGEPAGLARIQSVLDATLPVFQAPAKRD